MRGLFDGTEYSRIYGTSFGTYLYPLFHIVVFDVQALAIPWHQFVYTLFIPCGHLVIQPGHDSILQVFITCEAFYWQGALHFWKREKIRQCQVQTVCNNSHSYLCTYHVTKSDVQLHEATFQHHTENRNQWLPAPK